MEWLSNLATVLPRLKTPLQLTGLIVIVAAVVMTQAVKAANIQAHISMGAIGILLVIFGQLFHFLGTAIPRKERGKLLVIMFVLFSVFILALIAATSYFYLKPGRNVVLMDSPARPYDNDDNLYLNNATVAGILDDLPVNLIKEPTHPNWVEKRCQAIRNMNPELVIIHQSAFCAHGEANTTCHESDQELFGFFRCMQDMDTKFLVYTRYTFGGSLLAAAQDSMPRLLGRLVSFPMTRKDQSNQYRTYTFAHPMIRRDLKQCVTEMLGLRGSS